MYPNPVRFWKKPLNVWWDVFVCVLPTTGMQNLNIALTIYVLIKQKLSPFYFYRSSDRDTKRIGMLNLVNQLFKVYFRINKLHLCKPLIRAIESSAYKDSFPLAQQITYKYFVGRKAMFDSDYQTADKYLSYAFNHCHKKFPKNKRLILIYLVPVKMLLGYMPKREMLERYDVLQFHELACALKEGNIAKFDEVILRHEKFFIEYGIYLIVEKLKMYGYRNLFKRVRKYTFIAFVFFFSVDTFTQWKIQFSGVSNHTNASIGLATFPNCSSICRRNGYYDGRNTLHRSEFDLWRTYQRIHLTTAQQTSRVQTKSVSSSTHYLLRKKIFLFFYYFLYIWYEKMIQ